MQDKGLKLQYVLASEADIYVAADNITQFGYVTAVDAVKLQVTCIFFDCLQHSLMKFSVKHWPRIADPCSSDIKANYSIKPELLDSFLAMISARTVVQAKSF